jgi:hypothetical protein
MKTKQATGSTVAVTTKKVTMIFQKGIYEDVYKKSTTPKSKALSENIKSACFLFYVP